MNAFDQTLLRVAASGATEGTLDGWLSKTAKKIKDAHKKVAGKVFDAVKTAVKSKLGFFRSVAEDPEHILQHAEKAHRDTLKAANHVRVELGRATIPAEVREVMNKVGSTVANNQVFRVVVTAVLSAYGLGLAAAVAFSALDAYNMKLMKDAAKRDVPLEQALTPAEMAEINQSLEFMLGMVPADQEAILGTLSPGLQDYARKWLAANQHRAPKIAEAGIGSPATSAAYRAGMDMAAEPELQATIRALIAEGKSPAEIEKLILESDFYRQTAPDIKNAAMTAIYEDYFEDVPRGTQLAAEAAQKTQPSSGLLVPLLGAATLLTVLM